MYCHNKNPIMRQILQFFFTLLIFDFAFSHMTFTYNPKVDISYNFHSTNLTWFDAKITCLEEDAKLAMPRTIDEMQAMKEIMNANNFYSLVFVDSHDNFEQNEYITQGQHIQYFYNNWGTEEPSSEDENCIAMRYVGTLHDIYCTRLCPFLCQRDNHTLIKTTIKTDDPEYVYENSTKKFIKLHMHMRTWPQARSTCVAEGGNLAIIENENQEALMVKMFSDPEKRWPSAGDFAHIGFHDIYRSRKFYTVTDVDFLKLEYVHWLTGKPNNVTERCGSMHITGGLSEYYCGRKAQFFCERKS